MERMGVVVVAWRTARSLQVLLAEVDAAAPRRKRTSDGTLGDRAHSERESDHNPDANGVVRALDVTHDPAGGHDCAALAAHLRSRALAGDRRVKYVIWDRQICSASTQWLWRAYRGPNPHTARLHLSVTSEADDSDAPWDWADSGATRWSHELGPGRSCP
jgi:hypothetical protein